MAVEDARPRTEETRPSTSRRRRRPATGSRRSSGRNPSNRATPPNGVSVRRTCERRSPSPLRESSASPSDEALAHSRVRLIAFASGRGGTGRSLLAANVAVYLAQAAKKVIAIDADPGRRTAAPAARRRSPTARVRRVPARQGAQPQRADRRHADRRRRAHRRRGEHLRRLAPQADGQGDAGGHRRARRRLRDRRSRAGRLHA